MADKKKRCLTDEELLYFKNKLLEEKQKILDYMDKKTEDLQISRDILDEVDMAVTEYIQSVSIRVADRERKLLKRIDYVLSKIDDGSYGVCESCGECIPKERLEIRPVALLCVKCKSEQEKREKEEKRKRRKTI